MPKDEFDFEDPLELNGVAILSSEDTSEPMTECFIEEFARLGYNHKQILALFRNPHYLGMNLALQQRGEEFVRQKISEAFALRGKPIGWPEESRAGVSPAPRDERSQLSPTSPADPDRRDARPTLTDPMGAPIPDVTL